MSERGRECSVLKNDQMQVQQGCGSLRHSGSPATRDTSRRSKVIPTTFFAAPIKLYISSLEHSFGSFSSPPRKEIEQLF